MARDETLDFTTPRADKQENPPQDDEFTPLLASAVSVRTEHSAVENVLLTASKLLNRGKRPEELPVGCSLFAASLNICNAALGAGLLLFPHLFSQLGITLGICSMVLAAFLMGMTLHVLAMAGDESGEFNYQLVVANLTGKPAAGKAVSVTMGIYLFGTCVSYLVLIADQILAVLGEGTWVTRPIIVWISAALALPLMIPKNISFLSPTSGFGVLVTIYVVIDILYHSARQVSTHGIAELGASEGNSSSWGYLGAAFALYSFSFQCHLVFIPVYNSIQQRTVQKMDVVILGGFSLCLTLYLAVGILGYLAFGNQVDPDILAFNLPSTVDTTLARIALALKSLVSYPLLHHPARMCFCDLLGIDILNNAKFPTTKYLAVTIGFLLACAVIGSSIDRIDDVIDLVSALLGVFQVYFWPGVLLMILRPSLLGRSSGFFFCTVGFAITLFGTWNTVDSIMARRSY